MRKKNLLNCLIIIVIVVLVYKISADIPEGYYDGTEGLCGEDLKTALHGIISGHIAYSYDHLRDYILPDTDEDPANPANVLLIYSGFSRPKTAFGNGADNWNREHVWAQSHGNFGTSTGAGTDAHHIRPSHPYVNSSRGNKDFDNGGEPHPIAIGCFHDNDSWEPRDAVKGDIARMIMYMEIRYNGGSEINLEMVDYIPSSPNGEPFHAKKSALLDWHEFDLPDDLELDRHEKIYDWQENRNPFIDHPEFVRYIWHETIADFTADITMGYSPLTVNFFDISDYQGDIISWSWDLDGDGLEDSSLQNPAFIYNEDGVYDVSLTIEDHFGNVSTETKTAFILIGEANVPVSILSESFEQPPEWVVYNAASNNNWTRSNEVSNYSYPASVPDGDWYMYMNNYQSNEPGDDWLISPLIDLNAFSNVNLTFQAWTKFTESILGLQVLASTDYAGYGNPSLADWTVLPANLPPQNSAVWTECADISLTAYENSSSFSLAFHYTSTGTSSSTCVAWAVDAVNITGIDFSSAGDPVVSRSIDLSNYPNPFNPSTTISFSLAREITEGTELLIYNLKGQKVKTFVPNSSHASPAGRSPESVEGRGAINNYSIVWNGKDDSGKPVSSGIYFYKLNLADSPFGKMLLLK